MNNRNKFLIITSVIFLVIGLLVFLIGGYLAGWDFVGWFTSSNAYGIYILVGLYVLIVGGFFIKDKINNL